MKLEDVINDLVKNQDIGLLNKVDLKIALEVYFKIKKVPELKIPIVFAGYGKNTLFDDITLCSTSKGDIDEKVLKRQNLKFSYLGLSFYGFAYIHSHLKQDIKDNYSGPLSIDPALPTYEEISRCFSDNELHSSNLLITSILKDDGEIELHPYIPIYLIDDKNKKYKLKGFTNPTLEELEERKRIFNYFLETVSSDEKEAGFIEIGKRLV